MSLWRHRDFQLLWAGQTVSKIGTEVSVLAIPLIAMALMMGVASPLWIRMIDPSVQQSLRPSSVSAASATKAGAQRTHILAMTETAK